MEKQNTAVDPEESASGSYISIFLPFTYILWEHLIFGIILLVFLLLLSRKANAGIRICSLRVLVFSECIIAASECDIGQHTYAAHANYENCGDLQW